MPEKITPKSKACKDCGAPIYLAKMPHGKWWPVDVEPNLDRGRVVLTIDSVSGLISGRKLEKGDAIPDGCLPRMAHFMTCSARPAWDPTHRAPRGQPERRGGIPKQGVIPGTEKEPTKEEEYPSDLDLLDIPF